MGNIVLGAVVVFLNKIDRSMVMKKVICALMLLMILASFFSIAATSYNPDGEFLPVGRVVRLFQSGTEEIRIESSVRDTLTVYRQGNSCELTPVGSIVVISVSGSYFVSGKIISGEIKTGDIVKKGLIACIIIASDDKCAK
jgi:hypothetical protein